NYLAFEGKANSLKFVSALPIKSKQPEGFVFVTYEFKEGAERGGRLILYEQKVLNRDFFEEAQKEESAIPLLEKVSAVRFEYFREEDPSKNQEEEWLEEWNTKEEKRLPKALKMIITHKNGKKEEKEFSTTLLVSLPAHRFEEVRIGPVIRRPMFEKPR
ncbi:MAG: type II secretion system protein GspJ, partial [Candidatus Subteraquimicrobiales bacterium]|nr:type II secretion system protein GspJ [Candidatus Subteraquimicrobiales bacterium]